MGKLHRVLHDLQQNPLGGQQASSRAKQPGAQACRTVTVHKLGCKCFTEQ